MPLGIRLAVAVALASGCSKPEETAAPMPSEDAKGMSDSRPTVAAKDRPRVEFDTDSGVVTATVEVVRKEREIRRGLMYRTHLGVDAGMLFLFDREKIQSFWMKNTLISLDMIFIRHDMTVAGVKARTPPRTLESQRVDTPSQYVLEVNAGWAEKNGVKKGTVARFVNIPDIPPGVEMTEKQ